MQDGERITADEAGAWLREHQPEVTIRWEAAGEHDEDAYRRLLKLLFSPRADTPAA